MSTKSVRQVNGFINATRIQHMALLGEVVSWMWVRENGTPDEQEDANIQLDATLRNIGLLGEDDAILDVLYDSDEAVILFESDKRVTVCFSGQHFYSGETCGN